MAEYAPDVRTSPEQEFDREISYKALTYFALGLAVLVLLACAAMWWLSVSLRSDLAAQDPPPPALPEARRPHEPPGPRLQTDFTSDVAELRRYERELLHGYEWVDPSARVARIPIGRAMEIVAGSGLPEVGASAEPPAETPGGTDASTARTTGVATEEAGGA